MSNLKGWTETQQEYDQRLVDEAWLKHERRTIGAEHSWPWPYRRTMSREEARMHLLNRIYHETHQDAK
jgi:hypothetical protein